MSKFIVSTTMKDYEVELHSSTIEEAEIELHELGWFEQESFDSIENISLIVSTLTMTTKRKFGCNARHFELPLDNGSKYHILNAIAKDWKEKDCLSFTFSSDNHKTVTFDLTDERIKYIGDYALTGMDKGKAIRQLSAILKSWS